MTESAVVTLTCPQCGGQIHGVEATDEDRTVACTYCGTELHIPKIGGDVVHERVVVVERPKPAPQPEQDLSLLPGPYDDAPDLSSSRSVVAQLIVVGMVIVVIVVAFVIIRSNAEDDQRKMRQQEQARQQCNDECNRTCEGNPDSYKGIGRMDPLAGMDDDPGMREINESIKQTLRSTNEMDCDMTCKQQKCDSL